jgi:hypothetical protein
MITSTTQVKEFFVILSGYFVYESDAINDSRLAEQFESWKHRINQGAYQSTFDYLNQSYYGGYKNIMLPDNLHEYTGRIKAGRLQHFTLKKEGCTLFDQTFTLITGRKEEINFTVEYGDVFLFPDAIGMFSFKLLLTQESPDLGTISSCLNGIRQLNSRIRYMEKNDEKTIKDFIEQFALTPLNCPTNWIEYNPQLKTYTFINLKEDVADEEMDALLFDMGNIAPVGSALGKGGNSPSASYFARQLSENRLSVFRNWSALALYDTFTRVGMNYPDTYRSWEYDYFLVYIHCLYIKFCMYLTNTKITTVTHVTRDTQRLRDQFIDFVNDNYHHQISYKFLPDLLKDKIMLALEVPREIEMMEIKINRINQHLREKRERSFNRTLLAITLLSIFPVVYNFSEWLVFLGLPRTFVYPYPSLMVILLIIILVFLLLKNRSEKKKE